MDKRDCFAIATKKINCLNFFGENMKILKIILIAIASLLVLFFLITAFLPSEADVQRSIEIKTSVKIPFELVNNMKSWEKWSPWYKLDPKGHWEYPGKSSGVGSIQKWQSENQQVGQGQIEIKESLPFNKIVTELSFFGQKFGQGTWLFEEKNGKTKVTWKIHAEVQFLEKWFALGMDSMIGPMFEKSLKKIKEISENTSENNFTISLDNIQDMKILCVKHKAFLEKDDVHSMFSSSFAKVIQYINTEGLQTAGMPMAITIKFDMKTKYWEFFAGFPVTGENIKGKNDIQLYLIPASKVVKCIYFGPYENTSKAYNSIFKFIAENNLQVAGNSWESYVNDPTTVKPEKIETDIYFPVIEK